MIGEQVRGELNQVSKGGGMTRKVERNGEESEIEREVDFGAKLV